MSDDLAPADLWSQITAMPRASRVVPFPRSKPCTICADQLLCDHPREPICELAIWVLTQGEVQSAVAAAEARTRKVLGAPKRDEGQSRGYDELRNLHSNVELLFRACRKADDVRRPFFPAREHIDQHLSADEIGVLVNLYCHVQAELGPIVGHLTEGETLALIDRLKEGGSAYPLDSLSWGVLMTLVATMARLLLTSQMASSSPGTPPDRSTSDRSSDNPSDETEST